MTTTQSIYPLIAASDVTFEMSDAKHMTIVTGARTYTLEATPDQADELRKVLTDIVPLLRESKSLARDFNQAQIEALQPYVKSFIKMGLIFEAPSEIDTEAKRQLFTFLARRSSNIRKAYEQAREQRFRFIGPDKLIEQWRTAFEAQGLSVDTSESASSICLELVVNAETIPEISRKYHAAGTAWAPVVLTPAGASLGPWVIPGETACPMCPESLGRADNYRSRTAVGVNTSWLSSQTGSQAWIGGLLTHSALRVVAPAGPHSPWGRRIDLDFLRIEQETVSVWKDPSCAVCGPRPRPTRLWIEE